MTAGGFWLFITHGLDPTPALSLVSWRCGSLGGGAVSARARPRGPDLRGEVLGGRYRLEAVIGAGGMADVYEAVDVVLRRRVAVKALHPEHGRTEEQRRRFIQEAVLGAGIEHPHVMPILDRGEARPRGCERILFLVMPRVEGVSLRQVILEGATPWPRAVGLTLQLLDAVGAVHERGALHRDLKPENCLVARRRGREHVVLLDLGLAKVVEGAGVLSAAPRSIPGAVVGSVAYLSPEQARAEALTAAADLYAVGVILFELLTRRPPFVGGEIERIAALLGGGPVPSPRALAPGAELPGALEAVVLRALAKEPGERYGSAREFAAALASVGAVEGGGACDLREEICPASHAGAEEAQAALAAWTSLEYRRARALAAAAARRGRAWAPLAMILDEAPEG